MVVEQRLLVLPGVGIGQATQLQRFDIDHGG